MPLSFFRDTVVRQRAVLKKKNGMEYQDWSDIKAGDRIVWNGETYEIDGEVFHTKSPTGRISTTRCTLVRWNG